MVNMADRGRAPEDVLAVLNSRSQDIFRKLVERYLETGSPVASRDLARMLSTGLSPASVRNVMAELDGEIREAYATYDTKRVVALLNGFMTGDLSSFYFDVRKDALYCDPISSVTRRAALQVPLYRD